MDGFKKAGCDSHLLVKIMRLIKNTKDPLEKIELFNDYLERVQKQHLASLMNNDLRSLNAQFAAKYIDQVCMYVCVFFQLRCHRFDGGVLPRLCRFATTSATTSASSSGR